MTEEHLFELALAASPADRSALLDRECAGNPELRARVEALLAADAQPNVTIAAKVNQTGSFAEPGGEAAAVIAGRYTLAEKIGGGGMGDVWVARQTEPVKRKVALKLIKAGMDSKAVLARFEQERQALALMDHPNIARVLDGGLTADRRPFFVMELVSGLPLTKFCDDAKLGVRERLELFVPICQAVQHAHQKGIIHRDLKPSNILVTIIDGRGVPKVIDFGVAKATSGRLTEESLSTQFGAVVGTLEYMSPEQAGFAGEDIDTRADIYSLGVILYELLTGLRPLDAQRLRKAALTEMVRIIKVEEPSKPSTRISTDDSAPSLAALRHTEPKKLAALLRGELDWVALKCLEKQRDRRYETANALARDIQRYLADEVVEARPPSAGYRLKKCVRRHKVQVIAGGLVAAALVAGMVGTGLALKRALHAESDLSAQLGETKKAQEAEKARADELKQVSDFQEKILAQVDATMAGVKLTADVNRRFAAALEKEKDKAPEAERAKLADAFRAQWARIVATDVAKDLIDETILKPAVKAVDAQFKNQPIVDAQLRQALADRYRGVGLYDAAYPLQKSALETRRRVLGEDHPATFDSINSMGALLQIQGKYAEAEPYFHGALEKRRHVLGEEHPETLSSINNMGWMLTSQGKYAQAEPYYREAIEKFRRMLGEEHPQTLSSIGNMGQLLQEQGKFAEAEPYCREAMEKSRRVLGEEHPQTLVTINIMSCLLQEQGKLAEAEQYCREAMEKFRRVLGEEHRETLVAINNFAVDLMRQDRLAEAEPYLREVMEKFRRVLGEEHPDTL